MNLTDLDQQLAGLAGLGDPIRRALYHHVVGRGVPVSRDDAAKAVGISRPLAAYHLDRLIDDGLLEARYQRRSGRRGPGAGRPAKHYVRADRQLELSLPARDYAALAELLASAVEADRSGAARNALNRAAGNLGAELGTEAASHTTADGDPDQVLAGIREALADRGYEPYEDPDGTIRLRNCPFDRVAAHHRDLVCGANHAMLQALTDHLDGDPPVRAVLDPQPGRCCVALRRDR
ncbi:MAG TPA: helix-turn-helix domain-containing protein [Actinomycetota bacterium]|jgi:predicted ArsR family transcriptional regulator|nr:helix-turn-helix domain-containing protein [Actinomycetota bacterium]